MRSSGASRPRPPRPVRPSRSPRWRRGTAAPTPRSPCLRRRRASSSFPPRSHLHSRRCGEPSTGLLASAGVASLVLAVVHPTYAIFLWIPFAGFLAVRWAWRQDEVRSGAPRARRARGSGRALPRLAPAGCAKHRLGEPGRARAGPRLRPVRGPARRLGRPLLARAAGVRAVGRRRRRGAPADPARRARLPASLGGLRRRRLARDLRDHARAVAVHAVLRRRLALPGAPARRASSPSGSRWPAGWACWRRCSAPSRRRLRSPPGSSSSGSSPATSATGSTREAPPGRPGSRSSGALVALVAGLRRTALRGDDGRARLGAGAAADVRLRSLALVAVRRAAAEPAHPGLVDGSGRRCRRGAIVYSDLESSYRIAAAAPVYICNGAARACRRHEAETGPTCAATSGGEFNRTGDLAIPRACGADVAR